MSDAEISGLYVLSEMCVCVSHLAVYNAFPSHGH